MRNLLTKALLAITLSTIIIIGTNTHLYDFDVFFHPSLVELVHMRNPYIFGIFNPLYALVFLFPLGLLNLKVASFVYFLVIIGSFLIVCYYYRFSKVQIVLFLVSWPMIWALFSGNLEWLTMLSFIPGPWSFPLALVKPQVGAGYALYLALSGNHKRIIILSFLILILSFVLGGNWQGVINSHLEDGLNISLWPWGLLLGIPLLGLSIKLKEPAFAWLAGPFLSPYLMMYSYVGVVFSLIILWRKYSGQAKQEIGRIPGRVSKRWGKMLGIGSAHYQANGSQGEGPSRSL